MGKIFLVGMAIVKRVVSHNATKVYCTTVSLSVLRRKTTISTLAQWKGSWGVWCPSLVNSPVMPTQDKRPSISPSFIRIYGRCTFHILEAAGVKEK